MKRRIEKAIRAAGKRQWVMIALWVVFMAVSLITMGSLTSQLREREESFVRMWAYATTRIADNDQITQIIFNERSTIPFIMMSERGLNVEMSYLVSEKILQDPTRLRRKLSKLARINEYIETTFQDGTKHLVFYGRSRTLAMLTWFPVVQIAAFALLLWLWLVTLRSSKINEQNRVWAGLAKETAHQLGTPTSSLLGWMEYLKTQPVDQEAVAEMDKDLTHLMKVADRFSKIGSETPLEPTCLNELVGEAVMYFRKRIPRNVELNYNGLAVAPIYSRINPALFEWVVENLLKNALDALQGQGEIDVKLWRDEKNIYIDVADTGKGIVRSNREKIFEPGFSTKTRGWGLGLSLSRRVIEEYHKGRIFVAESEPGKGTKMRIVIN